MRPKVAKTGPKHDQMGTRMRGLVGYLLGPGRDNEHSNPHMVAGSAGVFQYAGTRELSMARDSGPLSQLLDVTKNLWSDTSLPNGYVWHCPISLPSEEGDRLDDDQWRQVAEAFMAKMGFDDCGGTKAPCPWMAVRHGTSKNGGGHIHIVMSIVREDGTKADVYRDGPRAVDAVKRVEKRFGNFGQPLTWESEQMGRSQTGYTQAEARRARQTPGHVGPVRREHTETGRLERLVRAAAVGANDEAGFVRGLRSRGVWVRPFYAKGGTDEVTGYSVALPPSETDGHVFWHAGGKVANDLTLTRLRGEWDDTPENRVAALEVWRTRRAGWSPRDDRAMTTAQAARMNERLETLIGQLRETPLSDTGTWVRVARRMSGVVGAMADRLEAQPGPLAQAAQQLGAVASTWRPEPVDPNLDLAVFTDLVAMGRLALHGDNPRTAAMVTARNLARLVVALRAFMLAKQQLRLATQAWDTAVARLAAVQARIEASAAAEQGVTAVPEREVDMDTLWDALATPPGRKPTERASRPRRVAPTPGQKITMTRPSKPLSEAERATAAIAAMSPEARLELFTRARDLRYDGVRWDEVDDPVLGQAVQISLYAMPEDAAADPWRDPRVPRKRTTPAAPQEPDRQPVAATTPARHQAPERGM